MVTEQEARDMEAAMIAFHDRDRIAQETQRAADLGLARAWFNSIIRQTLSWRASQSDTLQLENSFADRDTLEALSESRIRMVIVTEEIQLITQRIRDIKVRL